MTKQENIGTGNFFCVQAETADDMEAACEILLAHENLNAQVTGEKDIVVFSAFDAEEFRLVEMEFQMNFRQKMGLVCPFCSLIGETVCGHLTFTSKI